MKRYEVIESKKWFNYKTRQSASVYGAVPYQSDEEKKDWEIVTGGYTIKDNKTNTVGSGKPPFETKQAAIAHLTLLENL